jgi:capsule biosynthesis phosphatase
MQAPPLLSGVNVIVPMAGGSEDFAKAGYRFPKPLVNLVGRPMLCWLLDSLKLQPVDTVFLAVPRQMEVEHAIERRLRDEFPHIDVRIVLLDFATRGAAETLFAVLQHMSQQELTRRTISMDCDNIYIADVLSQFRGLPPGVSATWYFDDDGEHALYSYLKLADAPPPDSGSCDASSLSGYVFVHDVREKVAISHHANIGAYGFACGAQLKAHCEAVIDASHSACHSPITQMPNRTRRPPIDSARPEHLGADGAKEQIIENVAKVDETVQESITQEAGGWYISAVMRHMLNTGAYIVGLPLRCNDDFVDLGTPARVGEFLCGLRKGTIKVNCNHRMRFVFDLDGTLVTPPSQYGDYTSVDPIEQNIALVRSLKTAGHYIIIWTTRESERHRGNVGAIVAAIGKVTFDTLERFNIPYDELLFGKPYADAYIDHRAVNSRVDTQKELGWEVADHMPSHARIAGSVAARAFNTVRPLDDLHVVKTGPVNVMRGELHWYRNIPSDLADLFPRAVEISDGGTHMASIVMTKVEGVPFTHLLVNLCLTPTRLLRLLSALTRMHRCKVKCASFGQGRREPEEEYQSQVTDEDDEQMQSCSFYANLHTKLVQRYQQHRSLYHSFSVSELGFDLEEVVQPLTNALRRYEEADRACKAAFVHGDPVFSNVLMAKSGGIYLLDMRGALGDKLTTCGDVTYDLAKVYQSLCGYDFFLEDRELTPIAQQHLETLQRVFWSYVAVNYPDVSPADVRLITAQHFFAIVPLHEVRSRMCLYLRTARALMLQEGLAGSVES